MNEIVTINFYSKDLSDLLTDVSKWIKQLDGYVLEIIIVVDKDYNDNSYNNATVYYVSK